MNEAQATIKLLCELLETNSDLDFVSDGIRGGLDFSFKDLSKINIKEV